MADPNYWNDNTEAKPAPIPWGTYNISAATPDVSGWLKEYGPGGSNDPTWTILMAPNTIPPQPAATTTATMTFSITGGSGVESTMCWGTAWFAFVPYDTSKGRILGGGSTAQSTIYLLQIDSAIDGNQTGWYTMSSISGPPTLVQTLSKVHPPAPGQPSGIWFYFDYGKQMAYTGIGTGTIAIGENSIDKKKGVNLPNMLGTNDTNFAYVLAFVKLDVDDTTSTYGGVGPVRVWTDEYACCLPQGWTGTPFGSVDCGGYSPGNTSCTNIVGSNSLSPKGGYCGFNANDPMCACQNGPFDSGAQNMCFAEGCSQTTAYLSDAYGKVECSSCCNIDVNVIAGGNVDMNKVDATCFPNPIMNWLTSYWYIVLAGGIGLALLGFVFWLFYSGWL